MANESVGQMGCLWVGSTEKSLVKWKGGKRVHSLERLWADLRAAWLVGKLADLLVVQSVGHWAIAWAVMSAGLMADCWANQKGGLTMQQKVDN